MSITSKEIVNIQQLKFDKLNPRLPKRLQGITDEAKIIDYMLKNGNILELMKSIAETGYSEAEPLLVVLDANDKKYVVVEGNRRLTAVKLLNDPSLAKVRITSVDEIVKDAIAVPIDIPVIIYSAREDILDYLGYRHITGVKEWGALEKACYLDQLYHVHFNEESKPYIYTKLAKMIGSRADYVSKLHQALKLYNMANDEAYYGANITDGELSFSWITTAIGYSEISHYLNITEYMDQVNKENYKKLFIWMFDPQKKVIGDSREISELARIISQESSLKKLETGSTIDEAILYTSVPSESFLEMLKYARKYLKQAKDAIEQLSDEPNGARDILEEITKIVKTINGGLDSNFSEDEKDILKKIPKDQLEALVKMIRKSEE
jgi:hypothetical protein